MANYHYLLIEKSQEKYSMGTEDEQEYQNKVNADIYVFYLGASEICDSCINSFTDYLKTFWNEINTLMNAITDEFEELDNIDCEKLANICFNDFMRTVRISALFDRIRMHEITTTANLYLVLRIYYALELACYNPTTDKAEIVSTYALGDETLEEYIERKYPGKKYVIIE